MVEENVEEVAVSEQPEAEVAEGQETVDGQEEQPPTEENVVESDEPRPLQLGDEGEEVRELQGFLSKIGKLHEDFVHGTFDGTTAEALKAFQESQVIPPTGVYDLETESLLRGFAGAE